MPRSVAYSRRRERVECPALVPPRTETSVTTATQDPPAQSPTRSSSPEPGYRAALCDQLAEQLDGVRDEAESALRGAVCARKELAAAWLTLCDRGWPDDPTSVPIDATPALDWLDVWGEYVALPIRVLLPRDLVRQRRIRGRLERCELALRDVLPVSVWTVVDPLDETGRSTLAFILQAYQVWAEAKTRCDLALRQRERIAACFARLSPQARALDLSVPAAPLDLDAWEAVGTAAREIAESARRVSAA